MKAVVFQSVGQVAVMETSVPILNVGEALVRIKAAALNHRDAWIKSGQYAGLKFPLIPGSDGAGIVEAVAPGVDRSWLGREVIIYPALDWGPSSVAQSSQFSILGLPRDGTLAEYVAVPAIQLSPKPAHLTHEEAAALPLSGVTAWRALFSRALLKGNEKVLISGIGGGTALFLLQYAVSHGNPTWVTSGSTEKISRAKSLGALGGAVYTGDNWSRELQEMSGGFDVIVDSAGGPGFSNLIDLAAPGGRIVFFGATRGNVPDVALRKLFWRQLSLLGSTMGSPADWQAMLQYVCQHQIKPIVSEIFPLERAGEAFALMEGGGQFGKIVVTV